MGGREERREEAQSVTIMVQCHCLGQELFGRFFSLDGWSFNGNLPGTPEAPTSFSGQEHIMFLSWVASEGNCTVRRKTIAYCLRGAVQQEAACFRQITSKVHPMLSNQSTQGQP